MRGPGRTRPLVEEPLTPWVDADTRRAGPPSLSGAQRRQLPAGPPVLLLVYDRDIRIIPATTGGLLRELILMR